MSQRRPDEVTFEKLKQFLSTIGFECRASVPHALALYHDKTGAMIMLSLSPDGVTVRPADLLSVLTRLENEGLIGDDALRDLKMGKLPLAS